MPTFPNPIRSQIASWSSAIRIDFRHSRVHCDCIPFIPKTTFQVQYLTLLISVVAVWTVRVKKPAYSSDSRGTVKGARGE